MPNTVTVLTMHNAPALFGRFFAKNGRRMCTIGGGVIRDEEPELKKMMYFEQIIIKCTKFGQNCVLFYKKKMETVGSVIWQKIGWPIEKSDF